jgi:hypothetical protein
LIGLLVPIDIAMNAAMDIDRANGQRNNSSDDNQNVGDGIHNKKSYSISFFPVNNEPTGC